MKNEMPDLSMRCTVNFPPVLLLFLSSCERLVFIQNGYGQKFDPGEGRCKMHN